MLLQYLRRYALLCGVMFLCACEDDSASAGDGLIELEAIAAADGSPQYVIRGDDATIEVWTADDSQASQVLYASSAEQTRVVFDAMTGDVERVIDELSGEYTIVTEAVGRIEFVDYDVNGEFVQAFALTSDGPSFQLAKLTGRAAIGGQQLQGQLTGQKGVEGSFALIPSAESVALEDVRDVTPQVKALLQGLSGADAVHGFNGIGVKSSALISLPRALKGVGILLVGAGLAGVAAPAYGAAGVAMVMSGFFSNQIGKHIRDRFMSDEPFVQSLVDITVKSLRDEGSFDPIDACKDIADRASELVKAAETRVTNIGRGWRSRATFEEVEYSTYESGTQTSADELPEPTGKVPGIASDVTGQAVFADNSSYTLKGTVDEDGVLHVTGDAADDPKSHLQLDGSVTSAGDIKGNFKVGAGSSSDSGTITGKQRLIGDCQSVQESGGQGTFTNAHFVGSGGGMTTFSYNAFSVPDAFTVRSATTFSTGGVVSGTGTQPLTAAIDGFVFVSVSAPEDGTEWQYNLTCLGESP